MGTNYGSGNGGFDSGTRSGLTFAVVNVSLAFVCEC